MVQLLPIASENAQKWWKIPEQFSTDMVDVVFDSGAVVIGWFKRLDPSKFDAVSAVVNLPKLQEMFVIGSDLTHILSLPGRITGVLKAENLLKLSQSFLRLTRTVASIAKVIFDYGIVVSPKGQSVAGKVKFSTWALYGATSVGEKLWALYDPTDEQKQYGYIILSLDLVKSVAFLALGIIKLFDRPEIKRYVLPVSSVLLLLASTVYISQKIVKTKNAKD